MGQELAIMKHVAFGMRDGPAVGMFLTIEMIDGEATLFIPAREVVEMCRKNTISDIKDLEGKPCIVEVATNNIVRFVEAKL